VNRRSARVALVTGATDGIGRATAELLGRSGWHVLVVGRNAGRCRDVASAIVAAGGSAEAHVADLSSMPDVRRLADEVRGVHDRLDVLLLNANTITQQRRVTADGFEANLAVGFLGRTLLQWALEPLLSATPGAQVLTVVGLDHERLDLANPQLEHDYTAWKGLKRWQWAVQVLARETNRRGRTATNVFMPGLVKTKILADEPQPRRALVKLMNFIIGIPTEQSAADVVSVLDQVVREGRRDTYFYRSTPKPPRELKSTPEDGAAVWSWAEATLAPWLR
jgi:NAD(P)-dependent dehydrogenase (short-subunit alcohol dehydrogenase family)